MQTQEKAPAAKPPYIAFRTLLDLIERMEQEGAPPRIDRSYLENYSGGYGGQVIAALESLDLLGEDGTLKPRLMALILADEGERKNLMGEILENRYPGVVSLGKINATQQQHEDAFREMEVTGDTLRKAIGFYIKAAQYAGVPLSRNFRVPRVRAAGTRKLPRLKNEPQVGSTQEKGARETGDRGDQTPAQIPAALKGLLQKLPEEGRGWEKDDKDRFMTAFTAFIDLFYPVVEPQDKDF